ncbi:1-phosphofructokinase family hexose kinase [Saccharopolyspora sp. NPDC002686]|uniref:1-phosphofructokinase family hexose kinase n=1 Tax=Saccharopolyspora sp. NPDC002686 TaxID=3154541 RepID=UPI003328212B
MITTVTANPSVDRTICIDSLVRGDVLRGTRSSVEPSGKGVNVTLALHTHGHATTAVLPLGGASGAELRSMLDASGAGYVAVPIAEAVRSNISLLEPDGTVTKANEPGPQLTPPEIEALAEAAITAATSASWLACCGSLPVGVAPGFYADLIARGSAAGCRTVVDSSGPCLEKALDASPDLIKPNIDELAELTGRRLHTLGDVVDAGKLVRGRGVGAVLASLGPRGAVLLDHDGVLHGEAPVGRPVSTVGAGDALLAGFLAGGGRGAEALHMALRWAATAVQQPGTLFSGADFNADPGVTITATPDLSLRLT